MQIVATAIADVRLVIPRRFYDDRGYFAELFNREKLLAAGIDMNPAQVNQSFSRAPWTLRGLHFQTPPHAQAKLVRAVRGRILDIAVDLRHGSPSFGHHVATEISAEGGEQMFVPKGFAHGTFSLEQDTEVAYVVDDRYAPECEGGVAFDDPELAIAWPVETSRMMVAPRDRSYPRLRDLPAHFRYAPSA
jgi:dTDP-4-dehydrorhamnose 3,5-epimerase